MNYVTSLLGSAALILTGVGAMTMANAADNEENQLTVERIYADPSLTGPAPRSVKLSPDGKRVTFLKGKEDEGSVKTWAEVAASSRQGLTAEQAEQQRKRRALELRFRDRVALGAARNANELAE